MMDEVTELRLRALDVKLNLILALLLKTSRLSAETQRDAVELLREALQ